MGIAKPVCIQQLETWCLNDSEWHETGGAAHVPPACLLQGCKCGIMLETY